MEPYAIAEAAARLHQAEATGRPIRAFSLTYPGLTVPEAYAIQAAWVLMKCGEGRRIAGHKIGLTSKAMQNALQVNEPDSGTLLDDMVEQDGVTLRAERFLQPRVEMEVAFVLARRLAGPGCTIFDVLNATDFVVPALEILDSRMHRIDPETKAMRTIVDTVSDNAANAALVLGGRPMRPMELDLRWVAGLCFRNGQIEETGVAAGVLNHPAAAVAWLANRLGQYGEAIEPGHLVLSGSFIKAIDARRGDVFHADYGPFGSVSCSFT